ncbi:hypothetical protein PRIPAC_94480 [Pristionchus pacificus]|uniref:Uncharacterized protein n=1 Tax=Pristionchus pacificus TaxID=54126 RepID=A0A2A6BBS2_PRIPA|nr:hypothetical protein PRIPAC_94480 [Pristionchus pacificus]|eukprot:PDM63320.1 hypothetical protein PRIPAC_50535 [Pristionchus pacificus]
MSPLRLICLFLLALCQLSAAYKWGFAEVVPPNRFDDDSDPAPLDMAKRFRVKYVRDLGRLQQRAVGWGER